LLQAKAFENGINKVIYLKVSDKEALWRLSGRDDNREDDTLKAIRKRIDFSMNLQNRLLVIIGKKEI
jgi:adenylate kinase family enzyme